MADAGGFHLDQYFTRSRALEVHVNDFQATLLRLFGLDHERLTVNHRGLGVRLTNLGGNVIEDVIA